MPAGRCCALGDVRTAPSAPRGAAAPLYSGAASAVMSACNRSVTVSFCARGAFGAWSDAVFDGDFGLLVLGYFGGSNLSGRMLRGHVSGDVNMGQTITVVRAGDGGRASEATNSLPMQPLAYVPPRF